MKYTVMTFNINGYEKMHNIPEEAINPDIEYLYITDYHSITSDTWTVIYEDNLTGSTFDKVFQIRYNPFKYAHTDVVMKIDGSMGLVKDVMPIFKAFDEGNYDAAVMIHPTRNQMVSEYQAWVHQRQYPVEQANKCISTLLHNDYDMSYKGLYQYNFMIQRNNDMNNAWNSATYETLQKLAPEGDTVDRLDQTIGSFILNKFFSNSKIMPVGQYICNGVFFNWYVHNTERAMICDDRNNIEPFLFNRPCSLVYLWP